MFGRKPKIDENALRSRIRDELLNEREQRRLEIDAIELSWFLNKLVICVSNEHENVTVGYGKEITSITKSNVPMLVVHDIVRDVDILPMGNIFAYTKQKFDALNSLSPDARTAIIYSAGSFTEVKKEPDPDSILYSAMEWDTIVTNAIDKYQRIANTSNQEQEVDYSYTQ